MLISEEFPLHESFFLNGFYLIFGGGKGEETFWKYYQDASTVLRYFPLSGMIIAEIYDVTMISQQNNQIE